MLLLRTLLFMVFAKKCVVGLNFDANKVTEINLSDVDQVDGSYFGYSLLLQKGSNPIVIVGAPKQSNATGGAVFACDILNNLGCTKYSMTTSNHGSFNGNFLGSAIDGEDNTGEPFVACAPRKVIQYGSTAKMNYFLKGSCFYHRNSSHYSDSDIELNPLKNEVPISINHKQYYYDYAFAQAGIDLVYDGQSSSAILGGPGIKNWNGAIVTQSLKTWSNHQITPKRDSLSASENYDYLGYKVGFGVLADQSFIFAGAPRADNLVGKVKLFTDAGLYRSFKGEEIGSFFGSAVLAEDVNDDAVDDLFVGAPTSAGSSFDEGCVYYYKNALYSSVKLTGRKNSGARFGTNIVSLGDIDLDSFNDIAISAPYENDGIGAVYIFMGSKDGIKITYSQRLTPSSLNINARGFGMGISRGNDIDGNGHNDLAIGAYKSGNVIVIRTKSVLDFRTALESNLTSISPDDYQMSIKYCVYYKPRGSTEFLSTVDFQMKLLLDYRVIGQKVRPENVTAYPGSTKCNQIDVQIEQALVDIAAFSFSLTTHVIGDVMGEGSTFIERSIPYAHGCGDDNICQTQILVDVLADTDTIIWGLTSSIDVKVSAENVGEPGYQCQLLMQIPKELELRQEKKCSYENSTYICPFATKLGTEQEKGVSLIFDVLTITEIKPLTVSFEVKCLGENIENKETLQLGVVVHNSAYIEGKSSPEDFEFDENETDETEVELEQTFYLGYSGPSPLKSDVYLLVPNAKIGQDNLFKFIEAGGNLRGIHIPCNPRNQIKENIQKVNASSIVKAPLSRTIVMDCFKDRSNCLELLCKGDYLYKSSETAKYTLKLKTKTNLLAKFFHGEDQSKNILAYVSSAYLVNNTRIDGHSATLVLFSHSSSVPLWVYIVSSVLGVMLLGLIIFVFYKCHFFDRRYRDKMNDELLMSRPVEVETEFSRSPEVADNDNEDL